MNWLQRTRLKINLFIQKWKRAATPDYRLVKLWEYKGESFYKFENPLRIPYSRYLEVMQAVESYGTTRIGPEDYTKAHDLIDGYLSSGQIMEAKQVNDLIRAYRDQEFNHSILFAMASPLILLEGENPEEPSIKHNSRKMELYKADDQIRGFFLRQGFIYLASFGNQSIAHIRIEDFLKDSQLRRTESLFLTLISNNTSLITQSRKTMKSTD